MKKHAAMGEGVVTACQAQNRRLWTLRSTGFPESLQEFPGCVDTCATTKTLLRASSSRYSLARRCVIGAIHDRPHSTTTTLLHAVPSRYSLPRHCAIGAIRHRPYSTTTPLRAVSSRYSSPRRCVIGPIRPSPIVRPSSCVTPASSPIVPVQNISSALYASARDRFRTSDSMPCAAHNSSTTCRVMPSGQAWVCPVSTAPFFTRKICVAFVSAMNPLRSSISASSAPATFASVLARIDWSRFPW